MSARLVRTLPWMLAALALALMICADAIALASGTGDGFGGEFFIWGIAVVFGGAGWLIASRHAGNPIGWIFLVASISAGLGNLSGAYAQYYVDTGHGPATAGELAALYGGLSWMPFIVLPATFLLALFPDGRLLSPRWRPVAWCAGVGMAGGFAVGVITPGPLEDYPELTNPWGIDHPLVSPLEGLTLLLIGIGMLGSAASLVVRFRRSRGAQRQQIKWLALAGSIAAVTIILGVVSYDQIGAALANAAMMTSVMSLPVATVIAVLRYRLYDIDLVINRTLVYGVLTALLAGIYLGSVLLLQLALESFTQGSGLAVAASTLGTAALVRPARARIQAIVDRRFFRRKYDAAQTLASFGARLRDEVDLDAMRSNLRAVVSDTMQPSHVSLWTPTSTRGDR